MTREGLTELKSRRFGNGDKPLSDLSDRELEQEIVRRRRERAQGRGLQKGDELSPEKKQLKQYFANLELTPTASFEEVKSAYRRLMSKYHPDKHVGDESRHKAATQLSQSLTSAYESLVSHFAVQEK